jgi:aldehyde dehydrogenase (NAD+)
MNIEQLVIQQRAYFQTQVTKPIAFRLAMLKKLKNAIVLAEKEIFNALHLDLHKAEMESFMTEIGIVYQEINYFLKHTKKLATPKKVRTPIALIHASSRRVPEPYGVVLIMSPWNYPFQLAMAPLVGAIASGNTVILKPASYTPHVSEVIHQIINRTFDPAYISVVQGGREANSALLEQRFDYIFFTGSTSVGKVVMSKAAEHLTPVTLELGGKSPCIVYETSHILLAAKRIAFGKYLNAGQTCIAPDYCLIQEELVEPFINAIQEAIHEFFGPNPLDHPHLPNIVNNFHVSRLMTLLSSEAKVIGGQSKDGRIEPTVLYPVNKDAPIMQEEIFGPILPLIPVKSVEEIISTIESHDKPLAFYIFTDNVTLQKMFVNRLSFGGATINDTIMHIASTDLGFGGVGASGMGQYHGVYSFQTFSHYKSVLKRYMWLDLPMRYHPYTKGKLGLLRKFMK